ncbi:MAG TPA: class E sortase [Candidatus Sulfotelmatobacter sp.]|nr:class E sortase [Candidatus Sulfotelmatobacter sp.]
MPNNNDLEEPDNLAADLVRQRLQSIYGEEPAASEEIREIEAEAKPTKHQVFLQELNDSGLDLAAIQTKWHEYYTSLPDNEKFEVWQEFYDNQTKFTSAQAERAEHPETVSRQKSQVARSKRTPPSKLKKPDKDIKEAIKDRVTASGKLNAKHQIQSVLFGLGVGLVVVFIFLFGFFNEVLVAPLIQPSRNISTPIIIGASSVAPTNQDQVIIPKINVEIPVDYSESSTNESVIENDLNSGVVHYPTTVLPGQNGNAAFFGHSSNNIFNPGKYKFAFVLLHTLVQGDTFYLTYAGKVYIYRVISTKIVSPSDVYVLNSVPGQTATASLITCDPPGTSINRLVVVGQQISPNPSTNTTATVTAQVQPSQLPGNGPTLLTRFMRSTLGKAVIVIVAGAIILYVFRRLNRSLKSL